jgi:hypothetical protein
MLIFILLSVLSLVAWSLHLMEQAITKQQLSLMLAGGMVASASAALMSVYFITGNYMGYVNQLNKTPAEMEQAYDSIRWYVEAQNAEIGGSVFLSDSSSAPSLDR